MRARRYYAPPGEPKCRNARSSKRDDSRLLSFGMWSVAFGFWRCHGMQCFEGWKQSLFGLLSFMAQNFSQTCALNLIGRDAVCQHLTLPWFVRIWHLTRTKKYRGQVALPSFHCGICALKPVNCAPPTLKTRQPSRQNEKHKSGRVIAM